MTEKLAIDGGTPVREELLPGFRASYGYEELQQMLEVLDGGVLCSVDPAAPKVPEFERGFAEYVGTKYAIAFNSATTAQHASLVAAGVGSGDEVIVPPLTFASTAYTVFMVGATPIFADVDDNSITLDPKRVAQAITPRTKAIVPVHWFGYPAAMDEMLDLARQHNLSVIEDCAHGYGTVYRGRNAGTIGAMACWSLQETKTLTAAGEGGILTTDDEELALIADSMRDHGKDKRFKSSVLSEYSIVRVGNNYRLSELHAAFAIAQLRKVQAFQDARKTHVEYLDAAIKQIPGLRRPEPEPDIQLGHSYYPVRFDQDHFRVELSQISDALRAEGISVGLNGEVEFSYKYPLFRENSPPADLPVADRIRRELLLLPLFPDQTRLDLDDIIAAVIKVATAHSN